MVARSEDEHMLPPEVTAESSPSAFLETVTNARREHWTTPWTASETFRQMLQKEGKPLVEQIGNKAPLPTDYGGWTYYVFGDYTTGLHHEMLVFGDIDAGSLGDGEDVLVRMHSSCRTNEVYHAINCECRKELHQAMTLIGREGRGIILYLEQEGRGMGMFGKMAQLGNMFEWQDGNIVQRRDPQTGERIDTDRAYKDAGFPSEVRDFSVAGEMLKTVDIKSVQLLTNNPRKIRGLETTGIRVTPVEIHIAPDNDIIASDLRSKRDNLGHNIPDEHLKVVVIPPEEIEPEPTPISSARREPFNSY